MHNNGDVLHAPELDILKWLEMINFLSYFTIVTNNNKMNKWRGDRGLRVGKREVNDVNTHFLQLLWNFIPF